MKMTIGASEISPAKTNADIRQDVGQAEHHNNALWKVRRLPLLPQWQTS
jgi:hypothetical protein